MSKEAEEGLKAMIKAQAKFSQEMTDIITDKFSSSVEPKKESATEQKNSTQFLTEQKDTLLPFFDDIYNLRRTIYASYPSWLGDEEFHRSHRSNLLRKNEQHYQQFWPDERNDLEYVWPVQSG